MCAYECECASTTLKNLIIVKQFQINQNHLVLCNGELILGKGGVHRIELSGGRTVIDTETCKVMFSLLFGDDIMYILWTWLQDKDMKLCCTYMVSEAFPWITESRHSKNN